MKIKLEKGLSSVEVSLPDEKVADILIGKNVPGIPHDQIKEIIAQGIENHSPTDLAHKKCVIIIPDDTRLWARGNVFVPQIAKTLINLGVSRDRIKIIIALGSHADMAKEMFSELAGTYCANRIEILNSANTRKERLTYMGKTHKGTDLYITREAVDADHIIIFGGILHHMAAGFGGGRKYILPGIAGYDSIQQNHSLMIRKDGTPHPLVRQAKLWGNPVHEDMNDAAALFLKNKTCTYVAVAANDTGDIFHAAVGPLESTFMDGCRKLNVACTIPVPGKKDFALISAGGHRMDGQLYQATKALFNAINCVKEGGQILFFAGCAEGVGNSEFAAALETFRGNPEILGQQLTREFSMPSYVAFRVLEILKRFSVALVSDLAESQTQPLGFTHIENIENFLDGLQGQGYIIPYAENVLPLVKG